MTPMANRQAFINAVAPICVQLRAEGSPIFPSVRLAQAILETGGNIPSWNNLFGIKVGQIKSTPFWDGGSVNTRTREVIAGQNVYPTADWRAYSSLENCIRDHEYVLSQPRYAQVRAATTYVDQCVALYRCGYATDAPADVDGDPAYYEKLISIIKSGGLTAYDDEGERQMSEILDRISALEAEKVELQGQIDQLRSVQSMDQVPDWAQVAVEKAVKAGYVDTPEGGSYDFYRFLTFLDRAGKLG